MTAQSALVVATALAMSSFSSHSPQYGYYDTVRSSGPKNGKTKRREKQKASKKAKQKARKSK